MPWSTVPTRLGCALWWLRWPPEMMSSVSNTFRLCSIILRQKTGRALLRERETQRLNELHGSLFRQASIVVRKKLELVFVLFQDDTIQLTPSAHAGL